MRNIEKIIKEVNGSMAMEGMPLTEEDKKRMRLCAGDRDKVDKMVSELIENIELRKSRVMNKDYSYDYEYDDRYCYKQSNVLINKLNIKDSYELSVAEREITALRMMDAKIIKIEGHFDFHHFKIVNDEE